MAAQHERPDPPTRRPLEPRFQWRAWAEEQSAALAQLASEDELAHARDEREQLTLDIEEKAA